ncbi:MAG: toxin-antitoxin system YwqK family antitoxin [Bacteroidia bacterium]
MFTLLLGVNISNAAPQMQLTELMKFCEAKNWEYANQKLADLKWTYSSSSKGSYNEESKITWAYGLNQYNDKAEAWLYLFTIENDPVKVVYEVFSDESFNKLKKSLPTHGFKLVKNSIEDEALVLKYENKGFYAFLISSKIEEEGYYASTHTVYQVVIVDKNSIYDPNNGPKVSYYSSGNKEATYTLRNGEFHGLYTYFIDSPWPIKMKEITFNNGIRHGPYIEYDESGKISVEANYFADSLHGQFRYYENNVLRKETSFKNGIEDGYVKIYDEDGQLTKSYFLILDELEGFYCEYESGRVTEKISYSKGKKNGKYLNFVHSENTELRIVGMYKDDLLEGDLIIEYYYEGKFKRILQKTPYKNGLKHGLSMESNLDTLFYVNYFNGRKHGPVLAYVDLTSQIIGGIIQSDTALLILVYQGSYLEDKQSGKWIFYYQYGDKKIEAEYADGAPIGTWTHFLPSRIAGQTIIGSGSAYKYEYYQNGSLFKDHLVHQLMDSAIDCLEFDKTDCKYYYVVKSDITRHHTSGMLSGEYLEKDTLGHVLVKGQYDHGKKSGKWVEYSDYDLLTNQPATVVYMPYSNDQLEGVLEYFENGVKVYSSNYYQDMLHGISKYFRPNQEVWREIEYKYDNMVRSSRFYIEQDSTVVYKIGDSDKYYVQLKVEQIGVNIEQTSNILIPLDQIKDLSAYDLIYLIDSLIFTKSNKLILEGEYKKEDRHAETTEAGKYASNKKVGSWLTFYHNKGLKILVVYGENEVVVSEYYTNEDGSVYSGVAKILDPLTGNVEFRKVKKGLREGKTVIRDPNGKLIAKVKYADGVLKD